MLDSKQQVGFFRYNTQTFPATLGTNFLALLFLGGLFDGGQVSYPGSLACISGIFIASFRAIYVKITKKKIMVSRIEHSAWVLMPVYVIPVFILLFYFGTYLRYGNAG